MMVIDKISLSSMKVFMILSLINSVVLIQPTYFFQHKDLGVSYRFRHKERGVHNEFNEERAIL